MKQFLYIHNLPIGFSPQLLFAEDINAKHLKDNGIVVHNKTGMVRAA